MPDDIGLWWRESDDVLMRRVMSDHVAVGPVRPNSIVAEPVRRLELWDAIDRPRAARRAPVHATSDPAIAVEAAVMMVDLARWHSAFTARWLLIARPWTLDWARQFRRDVQAARTRAELLAAAHTLFRRLGDPQAAAMLEPPCKA